LTIFGQESGAPANRIQILEHWIYIIASIARHITSSAQDVTP